MDLERHREQIVAACKRFNVNMLYLVGSAARGELTADSDLDFVVRFNNIEQPGIADRYFDLQIYLQNLFNTNVDLIEESAIQNPFFKQAVDRDKKLIYGNYLGTSGKRVSSLCYSHLRRNDT